MQTSRELTSLLRSVADSIVRLASALGDPIEARRLPLNQRIVGGPSAQAPSHCGHSDGHELSLNTSDALSIETCRECPCCTARLWISIPTVGAILESAALRGACPVPGLDIQLTQRERQLLNVLHRSQYALRHQQLAALVWSDPDRTHDVGATLYRLRRKLLGSGWAIPCQPRGNGLRLVPDPNHGVQQTAEPVELEPDNRHALLLSDAA
jgi:hypothetical protein